MTQRPTRLEVDTGRGIGSDLAVRRVVTGHDAAGQAVVLIDGPAPAGAFGVLVWATDGAVADNNDATDGAQRPLAIGAGEGGGHVIRVMSLGPGTHSPMHRTVSLDYGIVLEGQIDLVLDDDEVVHLQPGDVVVQRGTVHAWVNPHARPCKIAFVILPATPVVIDGQPLAPTHR